MSDPSDPRLMRGTQPAHEIVVSVASRAVQFEKNAGRKPCLAAVLVGDDPASVTYVRMKRKRCTEAGIDSLLRALPAETTTDELVSTIATLSVDPCVDGILLQHPVPSHIDERAGFEAIAPAKDVDGVTLHSFATMALGGVGFDSCTPGGMIRLLDAYGVELAGKHAVVIGRSPILGRPVGMLLLGRDATVTYCHSKTRDLPGIVRSGDIVIAAVGRPSFIRGDWLKPGAVVLDAGYNEGNVGDVAFEEALERARLITPVPGGVGPMTIAVLLEQTAEAAVRQLARTEPTTRCGALTDEPM
jgi:methylenetetrahydrofolate dehydrogenase (NADP+) / methenyltetrahydrofolate cyclohydrolase